MIRPISKAVAIKSYATAGPLGGDVNLITDSTTIFTPDAGRPCEWIVVGVAGNLKITTSRGTTDTVYAIAGMPIYVEATGITATGTDAQQITVGW